MVDPEFLCLYEKEEELKRHKIERRGCYVIVIIPIERQYAFSVPFWLITQNKKQYRDCYILKLSWTCWYLELDWILFGLAEINPRSNSKNWYLIRRQIKTINKYLKKIYINKYFELNYIYKKVCHFLRITLI